ncbi:GntR family transcriptional regulator [Castellaniella sp.]|uniref:GntR family transcriptional regulator n=1 Tax=Castellaniella sp. TaxID=1955812 RepID=UPI0035605624
MPEPNLNQAAMSRSRLPFYLQLAAEFRRYLQSGTWPVGSRIPPLDELVRTYGVSRMTIRNALTELESEGLISRERGRGTFVRKSSSTVYSLALPGNWQEVVDLSDLLATQRMIDSERIVRQLPKFDMVCRGAPAPAYQYLCRLHSSDGVPYCYSEVYVEERLFQKHRDAFTRQAAASAIARIPDIEIDEARQRLTIIGAAFQSANALHLQPGESVAEVTRFACAQGMIIYYARLEFPTKFVKLDLDLLAH